VAGTTAAVATVLTEGLQGPRDPRALDPTSWLGILPPEPPTDATRGALAGISTLGVITLCALWITLVVWALSARIRPRLVVWAAAAWSAPFALGPPLFSRDVYAYAAQGELARRGFDPATNGIAALSTDPSGADYMAAVDPRWRLTHTPYGGGAVAVERFAATLAHLTGGGPVTAVVTLRVVAVVAVAVAAVCTARLAAATRPPEDRDRAVAAALALAAANPVTVIHLVSGAHLDALATAALAGALLADRHRRTPGRLPPVLAGGALAATALAAFAGTVKATAFLAVGWFLVAHARDARARTAKAGAAARLGAITLAVAVDLTVTAAVLGGSVLASGFAPNWIRALSTSGALTTGIAPASILANLIAAAVSVTGRHIATDSGSPLLDTCRALALGVAALITAALLWRAWRRADPPDLAGSRLPSEGAHDGLVVLGVGGFAVALGSPVIYPWYLAPALPMLAALAAAWLPAGDTHGALDPARRRRRVTAGAIVVSSIWLTMATMSPLGATWQLLAPDGPAGPWPLVATLSVAAALTVTGAVAGTRVALRRAARRP
jgi:hypothetical protein